MNSEKVLDVVGCLVADLELSRELFFLRRVLCSLSGLPDGLAKHVEYLFDVVEVESSWGKHSGNGRVDFSQHLLLLYQNMD